MKTCLRQWSLGSVLGGLLAAGLFIGLWVTRHGVDFSRLWADPEPLLMVAAFGALASGLVALLIGLRTRQAIRAIKPPPTPLAAPVVAMPVASPVAAAPPPAALPPASIPAAPLPAAPTAPRATPPPKRRQAPFLARLAVARVSTTLTWDKVSEPLQKLLGISGKHLRGKSVLDRLHPDDRIVIERRFQNPSKVAFDARFRLLPPRKKNQPPAAKPAGPIHVQLTAAPRRTEQGQLLSWRCLFIDITRQVVAEEARQAQLAELGQAQNKWQRIQAQLDRLKESYSDLYHNAPVMYFSLDPDGRFVTFNDTLLRALGYERQDLLNRKYAEVAVTSANAPLGFEAPSDQEREWETQWRRRDGSLLDVWLRVVAVYDEQGKFARWRSCALDFTERNRLANQLRAHTEELQRTNSRLRHINSELEDFTHVVSHDLKEPLRTLQAYSHLLAEDFSSQLSTDGFQYVNHLLQASQRLGHLIDDLLNLSHVGRAAREPQAFDLIEAVATVRRDLVDLIQRKEATILTEGTLPTVVGDPQRITQLLTNLVANGLKYNKNPEPRVTIGQGPNDADRRQVVIYVRDNGIGIDPKHHQQIFGLFRRVNHQEEFEGTGAGLAICKKIVEAHGGRIWVESAPGQGATFYFKLPTTVAAPSNGRSTSRAASAPASATVPICETSPIGETVPMSRRGRIHMLLVEDTVDVGALIERLGQRSGLKVTWFTTAEEAWDWLQTSRPDFMLLDINLPGMSGLELCRLVRSELELDTPITLISQEQQPDELARLRDMGANHFLSKELLSQPTIWQRRLQEVLDASLKAPAARLETVSSQ